MNPDVKFDRHLNIRHLDQWLGYWFIDPAVGRKKLTAIQGMNIALHIQTAAAAGDDGSGDSGYSYQIRDGVAELTLAGTLMKHEASDGSATSTVMARRSLRAMKNDPKVKAAIITVDSPGGTVAGAFALSDDIAALAASKPTCAFCDDMTASAAYLAASQCNSISAGRTCLVGSIGTVGVVYDSSAAASMQGIKVHVIRGSVDGKPAPMKGAGVDGTPIDDAMLARWQKEVDALNQHFLDAVQRGRKMTRDKVNAAADGGVFVADEALRLGLIDKIESYDQIFARLADQVNGRGAGGSGNSAAAPTRQGQTSAPSAHRFAILVNENINAGLTREPAIRAARQEDPHGFAAWDRAGRPSH